MQSMLPGIIVSFREGLEAFLMIVLVLKFLEKTGNTGLNRSVGLGFAASIVASVLLGFALFLLGSGLSRIDEFGELWASVASLVAVSLVIGFIVWMINHGHSMSQYVNEKAGLNLTQGGIFAVSFMLSAREGVEIAIFAFAGEYHPASILIGLVAALAVAAAVYFSFVRINIGTLFSITLVYLVLQAGYLVGYGVHEGISSLHGLGLIPDGSWLRVKAFDLSGTILNHKSGWAGLPLNVLVGWYSKPEWIQLILQYAVTGGLAAYWVNRSRRERRA